MVDGVEAEPAARPGRRLGRAFSGCGWLGFWVQIVLAVMPILGFVIVFGVVRGFAMPGGRIGLLGWFSLLSGLVLLFTTWWSWRYRGIGKRLTEGEAAPDHAALSRTVWTGITASAIGIVLSLVVILSEVTYLLLVFLEAPQGGAPVFQTTDGTGLSWITALDLLSLLALTLTASAEIVALLLSLWLLQKLSPPAGPSPAADAV